MGVLGRFRNGSGERTQGLIDALRERTEVAEGNEWLMKENMRQLELAMHEKGWRELVMAMDREFSRSGLADLMKMSRAMYLSHPLIQRAVNVRAYYTWGQGFNVQADADRIQTNIIDPLMADPGNRVELYGHQARVLTDVDQSTDGNNFFAMFTDLRGDVKIRTLPTDEVTEIIEDSDDPNQILFYRRVWNQRRFDPRTGRTRFSKMERLYPDYRYTPQARPSKLGGVEVQWDAPVIHQKTGGFKHMNFGIPETYAALDWARAYRRFLEDWHTIVASLAKFAWNKTTKASKIQRAKDKLNKPKPETELAEGDSEDRAPTAGAVHIGTIDDKLEPIRTSGATTSAEDGKQSRLMVGAAMDLPDTILSGDADVGNHATAKTLDRPTELAIANRQQMWIDLHLDIFGYVISVKKGRDRRIGVKLDDSIDVSFPPILEHDTSDIVTAITTAATLAGRADAGTIPREHLSRMLLEALNVDDIEAVMKDLDEEEQIKLAQAVSDLAKQLKGAQPGDQPPAEEETEEQPA